jgi:hypothetical protein
MPAAADAICQDLLEFEDRVFAAETDKQRGIKPLGGFILAWIDWYAGCSMEGRPTPPKKRRRGLKRLKSSYPLPGE